MHHQQDLTFNTIPAFTPARAGVVETLQQDTRPRVNNFIILPERDNIKVWNELMMGSSVLSPRSLSVVTSGWHHDHGTHGVPVQP